MSPVLSCLFQEMCISGESFVWTVSLNTLSLDIANKKLILNKIKFKKKNTNCKRRKIKNKV